jgi:hypothetical protein
MEQNAALNVLLHPAVVNDHPMEQNAGLELG